MKRPTSSDSTECLSRLHPVCMFFSLLSLQCLYGVRSGPPYPTTCTCTCSLGSSWWTALSLIKLNSQLNMVEHCSAPFYRKLWVHNHLGNKVHCKQPRNFYSHTPIHTHTHTLMKEGGYITDIANNLQRRADRFWISLNYVRNFHNKGREGGTERNCLQSRNLQVLPVHSASGHVHLEDDKYSQRTPDETWPSLSQTDGQPAKGVAKMSILHLSREDHHTH